MQVLSELVCSECKQEFKSASALLQHFSSHVIDELLIDHKSVKNKKIPNLNPLNVRKDVTRVDNGNDSGVEDVNPLKFCMVTMEEKSVDKQKEVLKKYECNFCPKKFGWPTDLKRHILIHTGEKPFTCNLCDASFTRNFLLQNHQKKVHSIGKRSLLPKLKPLSCKKLLLDNSPN
ncbi:unnamed protein product [Brassicogethes aeneus]|uniref:C2H2-type domain-containing protein n=1 Tax=Brassicogethes aeneus TaxID=1431903 RepID=A0A9P0BF51_BRAAE|nr:unnamed protein product [Brassicogethes aeneus]